MQSALRITDCGPALDARPEHAPVRRKAWRWQTSPSLPDASRSNGPRQRVCDRSGREVGRCPRNSPSSRARLVWNDWPLASRRARRLFPIHFENAIWNAPSSVLKRVIPLRRANSRTSFARVAGNFREPSPRRAGRDRRAPHPVRAREVRFPKVGPLLQQDWLPESAFGRVPGCVGERHRGQHFRRSHQLQDIGGEEILHEHPEAPAVGDGVMNREDENVIVGRAAQVDHAIKRPLQRDRRVRGIFPSPIPRFFQAGHRPESVRGKCS